MLSKNEILSYLRANISKYNAEYNVRKIGLFGSYARDNQTEYSDIDIVVEMPSKFKQFFQLKYELEKHFQKEVDIINSNNIRLLVKSEIMKEIIYV